MKPDKVQPTSSSSDVSLNLTCHERSKENSYLCPCSESNASSKELQNHVIKEASIGNKQVISRYSEKSNNDHEVSAIDDGVSRADEEQSKLCLIKCKNIENEFNNESSAENRPLIGLANSEGNGSDQIESKLISVKKNGSTLVFQKKLNTSTNATAKNILKKNHSLQHWQIPNNSNSHSWMKTESFSDIAVSINYIACQICFTYLLHL
jgi:hypothetical protein